MPRLFWVIVKNWQLKLLAVALAVLLWVVVSAEQVTSTWIPLPFEVQETDPEWQVLRESVPREIRVRFVGPGRELMDLAVRRPPVVLRIGDVDAMEQVFSLAPNMVRVPGGLSANPLQIEPNAVRLRFQQLGLREFAIELVARGPEGDDWVMAGPLQVSPARVRVAGPAELVDQIRSVRTVPFEIPAREGPFEQVVALDLAELQGIEVSMRNVRITGRVERIVERTLPGVPISVGPGVMIRPAEVDVVLRGPRAAVEAVGPGTFRVVLAIDPMPAQIPTVGIQVPLRIEGLPARVAARLSEDSVRLFPFGAPPGPDPAPGPEPAVEPPPEPVDAEPEPGSDQEQP